MLFLNGVDYFYIIMPFYKIKVDPSLTEEVESVTINIEQDKTIEDLKTVFTFSGYWDDPDVSFFVVFCNLFW